MDEREKFVQEVLKVAGQVEKRLQKYEAEVEVGFDADSYYIFVRLPKGRRASREFIAELEEIGLVYVPGVNNWGYVGKLGNYPPFKL